MKNDRLGWRDDDDIADLEEQLQTLQRLRAHYLAGKATLTP